MYDIKTGIRSGRVFLLSLCIFVSLLFDWFAVIGYASFWRTPMRASTTLMT